MSELTGKTIDSIHALKAKQWDSLFDDSYPFAKHAFLAAMEDSRSTEKDNGWEICHVVIFEGETPVAAAPCYIKTHSYGEYIFDWSWAEAYERNKLDYYPKLLCAIPYTPATGPRLGIHSDYQSQATAIVQCFSETMQDKAQSINASNWQCLFLQETLLTALDAHDWMPRDDVQFHWFNRNYRTFDDFLHTLTSRKRKNLRKERHKVQSADITIEVVEGTNIDETLWAQFYRFYQITYLKRSRHGGYLNLPFFLQLGETMAQNLLMMTAQKDDELVATALYFKSDDTLYGRYWGSTQEYDFLHFECCYYRGIEYCIEQGLQVFDAGAQGEHKLARGFEPVTTRACYQVRHPQFRAAIADFLRSEADHLAAYRQAARKHLPYKN